jgi:tRNA threonylcarbamoyladenosine biosynthesis protein TsaE
VSALELTLNSAEATETLGGLLAQSFGPHGAVYLSGELGAGKTTLVRGWLQALGHEGPVKSPTYTLVEPYLIEGQAVFHLDLYRVVDPEELELIGIRDYFDQDALCLVEWPERGHDLLVSPDLSIQIRHTGTGRVVELTPESSVGEQALAELERLI